MNLKIPLYFHQRTELDPEVQIDQWEVKKILRHKMTKEGKLLFLTEWEGADKGSETWEPVKHFFHRYCSEFLRYCAENSLKVDIPEELDETSRDISLVQGRWIREDYTVRDEWVRKICLALKVQVPKIDAFASREN